MREVVLDSETTGTSTADGDRIVSLGCVELIDGHPTGREAEWFCNPQGRKVGDSVTIHGLTDAFLARQLWFADHWPEIADFLGDARLVAHNAAFDIGFLNAELRRLPADQRPEPIHLDAVTDTMLIARRLYGHGQASLDKLIARFGIGTSVTRGTHGALKDARLTARVYAELVLAQDGGRQRGLDLAAPESATALTDALSASPDPYDHRPAPRARLTDAERVRHAGFVESLGKSAVWRDYLGEDDGREAAAA